MDYTIKLFWMILGISCLGLGTMGIMLPVIPTVPFYLATVFCFAKSSERLHKWFINSNIYKKYLDSYVQNKELTMGTKLSIIGSVTLVMAIAFFFMKGIIIGKICLGIIWVCHVIYFIFAVKTIK